MSTISNTFSTRVEQDREHDEPRRSLGIPDRYRLDRPIGRGGSGEVWAALDRERGESVAVKHLVLGGGESRARLRREVAALRYARFPGIVHLRDDGPTPHGWYIVMDLVDGAPFPGVRGPPCWQMLAPVLRRLTEVLIPVHNAGLVHRDLKPANVLVGTDGRVTVVDFGIARGRALQATVARRVFEGTPAYAAPEQLAGEPEDARTDLYALGIMALEALDVACGADGPEAELLRAGLPTEAARVLTAMVRADPHGRPPSAVDVLVALGGTPGPLRRGGLGLDRRRTEEELRALVHGPDRFHHLREDAARLLYARTEGWPDRVDAELGAWLRAGLGHWEDGRLRIDRAALDRLEGPVVGKVGSAGPLGDLLALGTARALGEVDALLADPDRPKREGALRRLALSLAHESGDPAEIERRLGDLAAWAIGQRTFQALDEALWELGRVPRTDAVEHIDRLLRISHALQCGLPAPEPASRVPPFENPELELRRRAEVVREAPGEERGAAVASMEAWSRQGDGERRARWLAWSGIARYAERRFREAADLHLEAMRHRSTSTGLLASAVNAAAALLEARDHAAARRVVSEATPVAQRLRDGAREAELAWIARAARFRDGEALEPDVEGIAAAALLPSGAAFAFQEAVIAAHAGRRQLAVETARLAERESAYRSTLLLARILLVWLGELSDPAVLLEDLRACPAPGIVAQGLVVLGARLGRPDLVQEGLACAHAADVATDHMLDLVRLDQAASLPPLSPEQKCPSSRS